MKKITLLLALLISSVGFSQDLLIGFETGESGGLLGDPFGGMAKPTVVTGTGSNTSQVLQVVGNSATEVWQGTNFTLSQIVDLTNTQTMTIDVKSSTAITFLVKVNGGLNGAPEAAAEVTHNGDGTWQTLSFTFNSAKDNKAAAANGQYNNFVLHAYWAVGATLFDDVTKDERTFYIDNVSGPKAGAPPAEVAPTDAPPTPPSFDAQNVMSLYSEAYTSAAVISNVDWDDSVFEEITIAGNKVLKVTGANFLGMVLDNYIDASSMTHLHMDYWLAIDNVAGQVLNPKLSNHAAQAGETSAIDISNPINSQSEVKNWQSKEFALNGDRGSIKEFLITQAGRTGLYYLDNVYLYVTGTASLDNNELLGFSMYPNPATNKLNISAKETIQKADVFNVLGKKVMSVNVNDTKASIDVSNLSSGIYLIKYNVGNTTGTAKFIKQ
ncbi:MAG: T9SS type A sorting domain-containing protein [Flavobacteriales bacterium]